jgi:hypothetical protein
LEEEERKKEERNVERSDWEKGKRAAPGFRSTGGAVGLRGWRANHVAGEVDPG